MGLQWSDIDLDEGTPIVRRSRLRPKWKHGCTEPCGHKFGGYCPQRIPLRQETAGTKSKAGKRGIGLPDELMALLKHHRKEQERERQMSADLWQERATCSPRRPADRSTHVPTTPSGSDCLNERRYRNVGSTTPDTQPPRFVVADPGPNRHGDHGMVEHRDGRAVPAHNRGHPARRRDASRRPALETHQGEPASRPCRR